MRQRDAEHALQTARRRLFVRKTTPRFSGTASRVFPTLPDWHYYIGFFPKYNLLNEKRVAEFSKSGSSFLWNFTYSWP